MTQEFGYEGLRSDSERSVPLLTSSNIFAPTAAQSPIIAALANDPGNPMVPCISNFATGGPPTPLPAATCAFGLQSILTIDPIYLSMQPQRWALHRADHLTVSNSGRDC